MVNRPEPTGEILWGQLEYDPEGVKRFIVSLPNWAKLYGYTDEHVIKATTWVGNDYEPLYYTIAEVMDVQNTIAQFLGECRMYEDWRRRDA